MASPVETKIDHTPTISSAQSRLRRGPIGGVSLAHPRKVSTFPGLILLRLAVFLDARRWLCRATKRPPSLFVASGARGRLLLPPFRARPITSADFLLTGAWRWESRSSPLASAIHGRPIRSCRTDCSCVPIAPGELPNAVAVAPMGVHAAVPAHLDGLI